MKNWGIEVTPKDQWIDIAKPYKTQSGKRVIDLNIKLYNRIGNEVTFPVKGTVIVKEKPLRTRYQIWTLDGRSSVLSVSEDDLVEC